MHLCVENNDRNVIRLFEIHLHLYNVIMRGGVDMFFLTGDTHGNQYKWVEQIDPSLSPTGMILVCGDFGVGFWNGRY